MYVSFSKGAQSPFFKMKLSIFYHCLHNNMFIDVQWISRDSITQANYVSKLCVISRTGSSRVNFSNL